MLIAEDAADLRGSGLELALAGHGGRRSEVNVVKICKLINKLISSFYILVCLLVFRLSSCSSIW